jgi:hypothetical protein
MGASEIAGAKRYDPCNYNGCRGWIRVFSNRVYICNPMSISRLASALCLALGSIALVGCSASALPSRAKQPYHYEMDYGNSVIIRNGRAVAPRNAPEAVHRIIAAGNRIQGRPYKYGGGHARVEDSGYDCSGTVSYTLIHAALLGSPLPSQAFRSYGKRGEGDWVTIYARNGHVFMTVGGLRLDTGYRGDGRGPAWTTRPRPTKGHVMRHPAGL